jgi:hypothetical protein
MKTNKKIIVNVSIVSLFVLVSAVKAAENSENSQMKLSYNLLVENKISTQAETIDCKIRVENNTEKLQYLLRPTEKDILLDVNGLDKRRYSITFNEKEFEMLAKREIPLRPKCSIEIKLAKIVIGKPIKGESMIPKGNYSIRASWKKSGLPDIKEVKFDATDESVSPSLGIQPTFDEYPLSIVLVPYSKTYYQGDQISLTVRLHNNGVFSIGLMNYFDRYKDFFQFEKRLTVSNEKEEQPMYARASITPNVRDGWITLLPGECLSTIIDAREEFEKPGEYKVVVTYYGSRILIYPKDGTLDDPNYPTLGLKFPPDGQPYYTQQYKWTSNEIDIDISEKD